VRLHPGSKALLLAGFLAVTLLLPLPALLAVAAAAAGFAAFRGGAGTRRMLLWSVPFAGLNLLLLGLVWPGTHVLASAGPFRITHEGLLEGAAVTCRVLLALLAALAYQATTPPRDVLAALRRFPRLALVWASTLRFLPHVQNDLRTLVDTQRLRGRAIPTGALRGAVAAAPLAAPLVVRTVRRGHLFQEALQVSGYDPRQGRTPYERLPWTVADTLVALAAVALPVVLLLRPWGWLA